MNAWPALQTVLYDGWIVRFANGYTKRANSVTPLYPSTVQLDEKIYQCEQLFKKQKLRSTFRLSQATDTSEIDKQLEKRSYKRIDTTSVQTVDLYEIDVAQSKRAYLLPGTSGMESWLGSFDRLSGKSVSDSETHQEMLTNIKGETGYMVIIDEEKVVACGLGVVERGYLGIFDVVTDPDHRNKGYGTELMSSLLAWGKARDADYSYLQVMTNNPAALSLYAKLGYTEQYQYWYRVLY
ncbi:MAG: GNAT family N-acetyltransferase [Anaerolineae bacterium]|nr:GNAT family N-acetyltransferase [Anaerolineae bacterium]